MRPPAALGDHGVGADRDRGIVDRHNATVAGYSRGAFSSNYDSKLDLLIDLLCEKQVG